MDWKGCGFVEEVPGRCSGRPTIVGTRIFPETIVQYLDRGAPLEEILEDFPSLTIEVVDTVSAFANRERRQLAS